MLLVALGLQKVLLLPFSLSLSLSPTGLAEVVLYLSDFAGSLRGFLGVHSPGCHSLMSAGFVTKAVGFYEGAVTKLQENWHHLKTRLTESVAPPHISLSSLPILPFLSLPIPTHITCTHLHVPPLSISSISCPSQRHVKQHLRALKRDLVWLVHEVLDVCYMSPAPEDSSGVKSKSPLDGFVSVVSDIVSERRYGVCMCVRAPVVNICDLQVPQRVCKAV